MNICNMFYERFLKRKRSGWVPRWSEGSRTSSATSTSSTKGSTASTIYISNIGHPQRPWQAQPLWVQQVPVIFIKITFIFKLYVFIYYHWKTNWFNVNLNQFLMNINGQDVRDNPANRQCLMNITGTCCTIVELDEVDEGASWSPWNHFESIRL